MEQAVNYNTSRRNVSDIEEENLQLWAKVNQTEMKLNKRKVGKKAMKNAHEDELRTRDRRELPLSPF
jgi:hypothetical protein